jgi:hypothetical protein
MVQILDKYGNSSVDNGKVVVLDKYGKVKLFSSGGGSGTVTSFSSGNLSPLFNTSVATPTTTPALSFSQISQAQNLFFASPNGSSGVPTFRAIVAADLPSLSSTYVPVTRNITINGTTFDLSADRTWSVGTVTSVAALTLGTTGTDLSSSVANSTTTPVITLNVPTASATNRGALSSTDWTTFNSKPTVLHSTAVSSATHTGTTANTLISSFQIDANSIADNQNIEFEFKANKINTTSGIVNYRVYINTSASLTGASLIGTYNAPSTTFTQAFSFRRLFTRRSGTLLVNPGGDSAITDYTAINGAVIQSPTVDFTVNQFIMIAVQLAATGQQVEIESVLIQRI